MQNITSFFLTAEIRFIKVIGQEHKSTIKLKTRNTFKAELKTFICKPCGENNTSLLITFSDDISTKVIYPMLSATCCWLLSSLQEDFLISISGKELWLQLSIHA